MLRFQHVSGHCCRLPWPLEKQISSSVQGHQTMANGTLGVLWHRCSWGSFPKEVGNWRIVKTDKESVDLGLLWGEPSNWGMAYTSAAWWAGNSCQAKLVGTGLKKAGKLSSGGDLPQRKVLWGEDIMQRRRWRKDREIHWASLCQILWVGIATNIISGLLTGKQALTFACRSVFFRNT